MPKVESTRVHEGVAGGGSLEPDDVLDEDSVGGVFQRREEAEEVRERGRARVVRAEAFSPARVRLARGAERPRVGGEVRVVEARGGEVLDVLPERAPGVVGEVRGVHRVRDVGVVDRGDAEDARGAEDALDSGHDSCGPREIFFGCQLAAVGRADEFKSGADETANSTETLTDRDRRMCWSVRSEARSPETTRHGCPFPAVRSDERSSRVLLPLCEAAERKMLMMMISVIVLMLLLMMISLMTFVIDDAAADDEDDDDGFDHAYNI